ncbi:hypothetical protein F5J12DRAFT_797418 [Pisolithus orientalis]|uniref:uncharacterized protein n=1 Tax=Pisolithus orientalis TaxID=936130 RepID=UPI0022240AD7|nr:uncharacterized protein F5J12DRAFT_797418 [Pisolithus orientalis]KAI6032918.1 hypothetical protein F5J12DRAFT_797418 [Pisolithus orientalis]
MAHAAADHNKRLDPLEGAPDPFPVLGAPEAPVKARDGREALDTDSHSHFPSLVSSTPVAQPPPKSAWGADSGPRIKANVRYQPVVSDCFTLSTIALPTTKDGKPMSLGDVMKQVMSKFKVKIEASANQKARQTTFHMKAETEKEVEKAKRHLLSLLSPVVTLTVLAPVSMIGSIVGSKGATLKQIRDQFGVKVDVPRKETSTTNGTSNETSSGPATPSVEVEDEEEPTLPVTITGPQPLALEARDMITSIISNRSPRLTRRVKDIPSHILPFIIALRSQFLQAAQGGDIQLTLNAEREVVANGDREVVVRVVEVIKATIQSCKTALNPMKLSLPKRQHRLLDGKAQEDIFMKSKCSVVVPDIEDPSEEVTVYGMPENVQSGLAIVMEMANSQYIHVFPLPGPTSLSRQLLAYITRINYPETLNTKHPGASVFIPSTATAAQASVLNVDIIGEKSVVDAVVRQMSELLGKLIGATKEIPIDWLSHELIQVKNAQKLEQFHEVDNVQVYFPLEPTQQSSVLLVYDPFSPHASPSPVEKEKHLDEVAQALLKMAKEVADIKTEVLPVEKRWHKALMGMDGNILDSIVGEDQALLVKFGAEAGDPSTEDVIWLRGIRSDVDNAIKKICQMVEDAKEDAIASSYFTEFEIDKEFVGRIVGVQGANINKLREQLNVRVDFSDEVEEKEKEFSKKKKSVTQKAKLKITGRKENADEAKKRILAQVEKLADETTETLKIPGQYHASLIGQSGKYVVRLEDRYGVKVTFPRQFGDNVEGKRELKPDEVVIRGGKKGVAQAKLELLEALDFEKEVNNTLKFTVPGRAIAHILGKGGATINEIKDETDAQIDIERGTAEDKSADVCITARGTKAAINAAKTAILAIVEQVPEESSETIYVEQKYHRSIIGPGGQGLKDLIVRCGGPSDPKLQAGLVRFPRQGGISDEVRLRGEPSVLSRIKDELENKVSALRDQVVVAVEIPAAQHRNIIGRGGQHLYDLQNRYGVYIQLPGSRGYGQVGEPSNATEVETADPGDIVKVSGSQSACEAAISDMKSHIKGLVADGATAMVSIPLMYHDAVLQQGALFRTLRSFGVQVEQSVQQNRPTFPTQPPQPVNFSTRIDSEDVPEADWQVTPNYQHAEEGSSEWTLKAKDATSLERARSEIQVSIEQAKDKTHIGFLTLPDRSVFPRLVGTKGSNIARLRNETGTDITVGRENNTIVIVGSESALEAAKEAILSQVVASRAGRR